MSAEPPLCWRALPSMLRCSLRAIVALAPFTLLASPVEKFQPLGPLLPSPNAQRSADGAPGPNYWQNRADYSIDATLDETTHTLSGRATITYHNASPQALTYL